MKSCCLDDLQQQLHSMICSSVLSLLILFDIKNIQVNAFKIPEVLS